jgi:hypothetical protein
VPADCCQVQHNLSSDSVIIGHPIAIPTTTSMYTKSFVALIAATAVSAAPAIKVARDDLQPWQITKLSTHEPSGRPGNDPHSTLNFSISDPNTVPAGQSPTGQAVFPPTTAACSLQYLTAADVPWGVEQPCTTDDNTKTYSTWTFTITKPAEGTASATENFDLSVKVCIGALQSLEC